MTHSGFLPVFDDKLTKFKAEIKRLRKENPKNKEKLKQLLKEAKSLRDILKKIPRELATECEIQLTPTEYLTTNDQIKIIGHSFLDDGSIKIKLKITINK